jgi:hypothetical protein
LTAPIHVVEVAAQRMRGWEPDGEIFVRLIDHGIEIAEGASRIHGYTREILERDGSPPDPEPLSERCLYFPELDG